MNLIDFINGIQSTVYVYDNINLVWCAQQIHPEKYKKKISMCFSVINTVFIITYYSLSKTTNNAAVISSV